MSYDYRSHKVVAVLSDQVHTGVAMNVLAHLAAALGIASGQALSGRPALTDASGIQHLGIARFPIIVTKGTSVDIRRSLAAARAASSLTVADFPRQMLDTGHDDELAEAIGRAPEAAMDYLGIVLFGPTPDVDAITRKFSLWR